MEFLLERAGRLIRDLSELVYPEEEEISGYRTAKTRGTFPDPAILREFPRDGVWGGDREGWWFETEVRIPDRFAGKCVVYEVTTGKEGEWDAANPQFALYVDGRLKQGLDVNHREALLTECARPGDVFRLGLSAFTGTDNFTLRLSTRLRVLDREAERYYYDLLIPYRTALLLSPEDEAYRTILSALSGSLDLLDLRREGSPEYRESLGRAQEHLTREFYEKRCGPAEADIYCVGHTHIDVAWLWTLDVTRDKAVRSFSTVLELMRRYPEYIFMSSQPQLYEFVKEDAPRVYAEIVRRAAEGRWEPEGAMFLEADCNLASGESLVRQFLYGKRFFRREFGKDSRILWLPDVFGYSAALPQIMRKCGVPYFMTTKISWNETNRMPCDTFQWEGIDGSRVLTHFVPTRDYEDKKDGRSPHYTTYVGEMTPSQVKGGWKRYGQKDLNREALMCFGFGDGGGGPTPEMLETQRRLAKGVPGCPRTVMSTALRFFETLDKNVRDKKELPTWVGELYLEYHRGTYTSMARNKKYNRRAEFAFQGAELFGVLDGLLTGAGYPEEELRKAWKLILLNQFHDILPGSAIREVYEESQKQYEAVLKTGRELISRSLSHLAARADAPAGSAAAFNPTGFGGAGLLRLPGPGRFTEGGVPAQRLENGDLLLLTPEVPSKGYVVFPVSLGKPDRELTVSPDHLENRFFSVDVNEKGQFSRIFDKRAGREVLAPGACGNVLMSYEDRPHNYDAWDINGYYTEKSWELRGTESIRPVEFGPVRVRLRVEKRYLDSAVVQYLTLYRDIPRIDVETEIDWREKELLLRALFPVDVHSAQAAYEIQFGNVLRPTHRNTSWDRAKFEVCAHKWLDLSEDGYGVSLLNDCKYGCDVHDGVIGLSLLKSAVYPNPAADKEHHSFTYSLYPHQGSWREAGTVREAYRLNDPMRGLWKENEGGTLPASLSLVSSSAENAVVETVKKAEDGPGTIVRLYECFNRRTPVTLTFLRPPRAVRECSLLEEPERELPVSGNTVSFRLNPYEIKTLCVDFE